MSHEHFSDSSYFPLCRECATARNGRLRLAGGRGLGLGRVHYLLDGRRVRLKVRIDQAPCRECSAPTTRFFRFIDLTELYTVERSGQLSFAPPPNLKTQSMPRRASRDIDGTSALEPSPQISLIEDDEKL